ncbi:MAG: sulfotransferase [Planctomycetes bacterium]|nr:sulfotransferase [Planctomycetota bacterium]
MAQEVDRPIFIVAPHRSGTTLLYEVMGRHPGVGYLNLGNCRWPRSPRIARLLTRLGIGDKPREAQVVWDRFWRTDDDCMGAEDATPEAIAWHRRLTATVLRLRGAPRFVAKYPRFSLRMGWLNAVFPDALFVHILRDWRAVVSSTLVRRSKRIHRSRKWYGMRIPGWRQMDDVPWPIAAGRQYRVTTQAIEGQGPVFGSRFLSVRYGRLCAEPVATLRRIIDHCGLSWTAAFEQAVPRELKSANYKWRETLDPADIERIRAEDPAFFAAHEEAN